MNPTPSSAPQTPHDVRAILEDSRGTQFLRRLTDALGYDSACERLPTRGWPESARTRVDGAPQLFATAARGAFHVVYARLACESLSRAAEREIIDALLCEHSRALFVFSNRSQSLWRFVNVRHEQKRRVLRRISVGPRERLRTACERVAMLDVKSIGPSASAVTPSEIRKRHDEAFDARQVTREFRRDYERVFRRVEGMIEGFGDDSADGQKARVEGERKRRFTQRLLSRMMLAAFAHKYDRLGLDAVFEETACERDENIVVPDAALDAVADGLFERYDFTLHESTPTDVEVAVDPEMFGKVFEEHVPARGESGSYYTPKPVVSFMCRESLKGYLGDEYAPLVDEHDASGLGAREARRLLSRLARVRVVDPACGSGAYLLGMLHELQELTRLLDARADPAAGRDDYRRKLQIITNNLYGVDRDDFAVRLARLRLRLSLADDDEGAEHASPPSSDFQIKCGDALDGFDWAAEFSEVFDSGGFDIVLANPPYGASVEARVRDLYFDRKAEGPQSKDTYGLFVARGLRLLADGGQMSCLVSDTWRTIKSHRPLRRRLFETTTVRHLLDLPGWLFDATVNTCVLTLTKRPAPDGHSLVAGDLRAVAVGDWESLTENLTAVAARGADVQTTEYARYTYPQKLVGEYDNLSFFVGSPRLYRLMCDARFRKLGDLADVKQGLATADNRYYLRKRAGARGDYRLLDESLLLTDEEIANLSDEEKRVGVNPNDHGGRRFLPYDKGGESDSVEGWLPNYHVPTRYFIDWSEESVRRLRTATVADVKRRKGEAHRIVPGDEWRVASRFQNSEYYFRAGLTFSPTGFYAPTYRLISPTPFDKEGSGVFSTCARPAFLLGILCSLLSRYLNKQFVNHTVHAMQGDVSELPIVNPTCASAEALEGLVSRLVARQKSDPRHPYHLHEQRELDRLVYKLYGLDDEDVREIELWYCRRYPRLAEAQGLLGGLS